MAWLHTVIDAPDDQHDALGEFWSRALGWPAGDPWPDHPELRSFEPRQLGQILPVPHHGLSVCRCPGVAPQERARRRQVRL